MQCTLYVPQNVVTGRSNGSISGFSNDGSLDTICIALVNALFHSCRYKNVAFLVQKVVFVSIIGLGARETVDGSVSDFPFLKSFDVNAIRVDNRSVPFKDTSAGCTSTGQVAAGVEADITETCKISELTTRSDSFLKVDLHYLEQ